MSRGWKHLLATMALTSLALATASCGGPEVSATASCAGEPFVRGDAPESPRASLILVDLPSNADRARDAILAVVHPLVEEAARDGGAIRLVVSGGSGQPTEVSPCLDGKTILHTDYKNATRERNELERSVEEIEGNVGALLTETHVSRMSNLSNLIADIPEQLLELEPAATAGATPTRVLLISDLDSPTAAGDCMSLEGLDASVETAEKVVDRCIQTRQYEPLPSGIELQVVRPQITPGDSNATRLSGYLAESLCTRLTEGGAKCRGEA